MVDAVTTALRRESLSLSGRWAFALDPFRLGKYLWLQDAEWISLPGSTDEAGKGYETTTKNLVSLTRTHAYVGPAYYKRSFTIPESWRGKRVVLYLERPHWETRVWLNQNYIGGRNSLSAPHQYELGRLEPGTHEVVLRIDNTVKLPVGDATDTQIDDYNLAHSVTDHTQTNWNGVIGRLELQATDLVWVDDVQVYPDIARKVARLTVVLGNASGIPVEGKLTVEAASTNTNTVHRGSPMSAPFSAPPSAETSRHSFELEYPLGDDMLLWDEFSPSLYTLNVGLSAHKDERSFKDQTTVTFGMRDFTKRGTQFMLNGKPVFLRGTLECCIFPLTGYPPTDVKPWRRIMDIVKAHGLNHLRFHSWCPPEAAFTAADEAGVMMQVEGPFWAEFGSNSEIDAFAYAEGDRILQTYGNHPSFCFLAVSNEPSGEHKEAFLAQILEHWRGRDPRRLYTSGAGWPIIPENDYHCAIAPRSYAWGDGLRARFNAQPLTTKVDYRDFVDQYGRPSGLARDRRVDGLPKFWAVG